MLNASDIELLRQYTQQGADDAFAELVRRHIHLVYSAALRHAGVTAHAEEITQAVFILLAQKAGRLREDVILEAWLYQTTRFVLRFFENRTVREVAAALDLREDAAQKRVNRATDKLRDYFVRRGVQVSTVALLASLGTQAVQAAPAELASKIVATAALKGVVGSGSTLTLIKGALKIMAWTKAKTAIVAGVGILFVAGTTTITLEKINEHRIDDSWRVSNPVPDRAPQMVKILPTKFRNQDALNVGNRGDNWVGIGEPVKEIARVAYAWRPGRIIFTGTQPKERYDFISTLPQGSGPALQVELKKKLGFVGHREMRDMDVLLLKVRRPNASGLRPPVSGHGDGSTAGHYFCDNSPLSSDSGWYPGITRFLEGYSGMPVIDQTGLTQNFHIDLKWNERREQDPDHNALKQALLDQLGLELVPSREPIEMLVVERSKN